MQGLLLPSWEGWPWGFSRDSSRGGTNRGRREACRAGPLQRLVRPFQRLRAYVVLGFAECSPRASGERVKNILCSLWPWCHFPGDLRTSVPSGRVPALSLSW